MQRLIYVGTTMLAALLLACSACNQPEQVAPQTPADGWTTQARVSKQIGNVAFEFPASGYAFERKQTYVEETLQAMQENAAIIELAEVQDSINVQFLPSRSAMGKLTGMRASGIAQAHTNTLFVVANPHQIPPIRHELMHLIATLEWGYPHLSCDWLNEGLAAFAENHCNGYTVAEIYRYFMETDRLVSMDSMVTDFYAQSEMIGYHQAAYIVEYLLANHGLERFKRLWLEGFPNFAAIYGKEFSEMEPLLQAAVLERYPKAPPINFEVFAEGCK